MKRFFCALLTIVMIIGLCACANGKDIDDQLSVKIPDKDHQVAFTKYKDGSGYCWTAFNYTDLGEEDSALIRFLVDLMGKEFDTYDVAGTCAGKVYSYKFVDGELVKSSPADTMVEMTDKEYEEAINETYEDEVDDIIDGLDELLGKNEKKKKK